jgi:hypothetical protein
MLSAAYRKLDLASLVSGGLAALRKPSAFPKNFQNFLLLLSGSSKIIFNVSSARWLLPAATPNSNLGKRAKRRFDL